MFKVENSKIQNYYHNHLFKRGICYYETYYVGRINGKIDNIPLEDKTLELMKAAKITRDQMFPRVFYKQKHMWLYRATYRLRVKWRKFNNYLTKHFFNPFGVFKAFRDEIYMLDNQERYTNGQFNMLYNSVTNTPITPAYKNLDLIIASLTYGVYLMHLNANSKNDKFIVNVLRPNIQFEYIPMIKESYKDEIDADLAFVTLLFLNANMITLKHAKKFQKSKGINSDSYDREYIINMAFHTLDVLIELQSIMVPEYKISEEFQNYLKNTINNPEFDIDYKYLIRKYEEIADYIDQDPRVSCDMAIETTSSFYTSCTRFYIHRSHYEHIENAMIMRILGSYMTENFGNHFFNRTGVRLRLDLEIKHGYIYEPGDPEYTGGDRD